MALLGIRQLVASHTYHRGSIFSSVGSLERIFSLILSGTTKLFEHPTARQNEEITDIGSEQAAAGLEDG